MHAAIEVQQFGKRYRVAHEEGLAGYRTLRETLTDLAAVPLRALKGRLADRTTEDFWAVRDVNFAVQPGEAVGIIGRNGAGKSTLLKLLARITKPSEGQARIRGRIGSLLEVGTGFHPELTGRENIYLNGAILGMRRREIGRNFDAIVEFAGVEKFLDTPVKRYSSGMYVRLAFAVAAHLEPEIMFIDEVLAVGDVEFQRRCLGRMGEVARSGRTILFVSHNMAAISRLCTRAIFLDRGTVVHDGDVQGAIDRYLAQVERPQAAWDLTNVRGRTGTQRAKFTRLAFENDDGEPVCSIPMGASLNLVLEFETQEELEASGLGFGIRVNDAIGQRLFRLQTSEQVADRLPGCRHRGMVRCRLPHVPLVAGIYRVTIGMGVRGNESLDHLDDVATFEVVEADLFGTGRVPRKNGGTFTLAGVWTFRFE